MMVELHNLYATWTNREKQKSKIIRDLLKLGYYDSEFSTTRMKQNDPFAKLIMVNGFIVPKEPVSESIAKKEPLQKMQIKKESKIKLDDSQLDLFSAE